MLSDPSHGYSGHQSSCLCLHVTLFYLVSSCGCRPFASQERKAWSDMSSHTVSLLWLQAFAWQRWPCTAAELGHWCQQHLYLVLREEQRSVCLTDGFSLHRRGQRIHRRWLESLKPFWRRQIGAASAVCTKKAKAALAGVHAGWAGQCPCLCSLTFSPIHFLYSFRVFAPKCASCARPILPAQVGTLHLEAAGA